MTRRGLTSGEGFEPLELLDARTGETATNAPDLKDERIAAVQAFALSRDESHLAVVARNDVRAWSLPDGELRLRLGNSDNENSQPALSPAGAFLALTRPRGDGTVTLWDITRKRDTGRGRGSGSPDARLRAAPAEEIAPAVRALEYSRSTAPRLLAGDARGRLLIWNQPATPSNEADAKPQKTPPIILPESVLSDLFAPAVSIVRAAPETNFPNLAATGHADGSVRLWDTQNKKLLATLIIFPKKRDDAPEMTNLKNPEGAALSLENFDWAVWTPDGVYAASPGGEKILRWRDGESVTPFAGAAARRRDDTLAQALRGADSK
jgi:WD40 repeat protein